MSEYLKGDSGSTGLQEHHAALLSLHGLAQPDPDPGLIPGFRRAPTGVALRTIAQASLEEVPVSARIGVLGDLARVGFPDLETSSKQYRELAASVADARSGVEPEQLLDDLKLATTERVPFHTLTSGRTLPHHEAAFVGEDVCTVREVLIGSLKATWIFSEFETDAPFDSVAAWVDPRNWPERGPMLFKGMDLVGDDRPVSLPPPGDVHWHGIFREEVQLVKRVRTLLHCDYWQDAQRAAGMTYSLALSLDDEIDVDQGFLLVNDVGPVRRVKALKIVGFTESIWDQVAGLVCPFWTEWVRAAVQGGGDSRPVPPPPTQDGARAGTRASWLEPAEQWIDSLGESARGYLSLLDEMGSRYLDREARPADLLQDQQRLFSQLAQDWAHAWTCGLDSVAQVAREGVDARMAPPDRSAAGARSAAGGAQSSATSAAGPVGVAVEGTTVPVGDLGPQDAPTVSDLVSIEAGGATIPASAITTTVEPLGADGHGARLRISTSDLSPGLYVGSLTPRPGGEPVLVQVYISLSRDV